MRLRIPRESFLIFPTPSTLYAILGGIGASLASGVVDGFSPALSDGVGLGDGV